jgi:capsule polysaccharide export protein KpsE/RkpR
MDHYKVRKLSAAETRLASSSKFELGVRDGIITVKVTDANPELAKEIANAYIDELHSLSGELAITEASQKRLFFEQQLQKEKSKLADAEVALREVQESTGVLAPTGQAQVQVQSIAQTRAAISSRQAALAGLRTSFTDQNPAVIRLQHEITDLQRQLTSLLLTVGAAGAPLTKVPQAEMEYVRREREVKYHEALFDMLAKQFESARLDESHDAPMLQVLDSAVVPDTRSGPPRTLMLGMGFVLGLLLGITDTLLRSRGWMHQKGG